MNRPVTMTLLSVMLVIALFVSTAASGGTSDDPIVTKSYVDGAFFDKVISSAQSAVSSAVSSFTTEYSKKLQGLSGGDAEDALANEIAARVRTELFEDGKKIYSSRQMATVSLKSGERISGDTGTMIIITDGSTKCSSGSLININRGTETSAGSALGKYTTFMFPETGGTIEIVSKTATVYVDGRYAISGGYEPKYMSEAFALRGLGLVRGAANGMELYRGNTRAESITMLIRLLGEEEAALSAAHKHPFTDVDAWAQRYVGYAYRMGYTKGVSNTRYDGSSLTTAAQYMTFILRSLGYSEDAGDFRYENAVADSVRLGVITQSVANEINSSEFKRDHMIHISYLAMSATVKNGNMTLLEKLVANGAVDQSAADAFLRR